WRLTEPDLLAAFVRREPKAPGRFSPCCGPGATPASVCLQYLRIPSCGAFDESCPGDLPADKWLPASRSPHTCSLSAACGSRPTPREGPRPLPLRSLSAVAARWRGAVAAAPARRALQIKARRGLSVPAS